MQKIMKKLIIHIGYPKTATTSLQLNLFSSLKRKGKIEYLNHLNRKDDDLGEFYCRNIVAYITGMGELSKCQGELNQLSLIEKEISLISAETLSIFCENFTWDNLNSNAANNAARIKELLSKHFNQITIIMTIRAQKTLIPSFYAQVCRYFNKFDDSSLNIVPWINNHFSLKINENIMLFNFDTMYSSYRQVFGEQNVHVLLFEDLKYNKNNFYEKLAKILNILPGQLMSLLETNIKNKTIHTQKNQLLIEPPSLNDLILSLLKQPLKRILPRSVFNLIKMGYKRTFGRLLRKVKVNKYITIDYLTEKQEIFIQQRFRQSNLSLAKKLDIDIIKFEEYGYIEKQISSKINTTINTEH